MKLQLKRSNVLESGAAKTPTAEQLDYGELAVNYNTSDPAFFIKDSANNVIRIAGVGSINDGNVPSGPEAERPGSPNLGDLYFDTTINALVYWDGENWVEVRQTIVQDSEGPDGVPPTIYAEGSLWWDSNAEVGKLFVLYSDPPNGDKYWIEASPTPGAPEGYPDLGGGGSLDTRYVRADIADHKIGRLAIGPSTGVDNIVLDPDGSAVFNDSVNVLNSGTNARVNIADDSGVEIWGNLTASGGPAIDLKADGSAEFAGDVVSDLNVIAGSNPNGGAADGSRLDGGGKISVSRAIGTSQVFEGYTTGTNSATSLINADGSAKFAGSIDTPRLALKPLSDSDAYIQATNQTTGKIVANYFGNGNIVLSNDLTSSENIKLNGSDGSAEFAGTVDVGNLDIASNSGIGASVRADGLVRAQRAAGSASDVFQAWRGNFNSVSINADGSATFTGNVTVGNYNGAATNVSGARITATGALTLQRDAGAADSARFQILKGNTPTIELFSGGSAEFEGSVTVKQNINGFRSISAAGIDSQPVFRVYSNTLTDYTASLNADGSAEFGSYITANTDGARADNEAAITILNNAGVITTSLISDGSATFAGNISSSSYIVSERDEGDGTICATSLGSSNGAFIGVEGWGVAVREKGAAAGLGCFISRGGDIEASNSVVLKRGGASKGTIELRQDGSARFGTNAESKITLTGSDGSADFAGTINIASGYSVQGSAGATLFATGGINIRRDSDTGNVFAGYGLNDSAPSSIINAEGSAAFSNNSAGAYTFISNKPAANSFCISGGSSAGSGNVVWYIKPDGSATFADSVTVGGNLASGNSAYIDSGSISLRAEALGDDNTAFVIYRGGTTFDDISTRFTQGGSAEFAGAIQSSGNPDDGGEIGFKVINGKITCTRSALDDTFLSYTKDNATPTVSIKANGTASFDGNITAGNVTFNTGADDPANYTTTTDSEGVETTTYTGPTLDVKDRLTKVDSALQALKTAAAAATTIAGLKSAIATALADI